MSDIRNGSPPLASPKSVVFLVHGTWAKKRTWPLIEATAAECLPKPIVIEYMRWTGLNRLRHRSKAAEELRRLFESSLVRRPEAAHYVIAHSHGGNIALMALDHAHLRNRVRVVICLSTPFLLAQLRSVSDGALRLLLTGAVVAPMLTLRAFGVGWIPTLLVGVLFGLKIARYSPERLRREALAIRDRLAPSPPQLTLCVMRPPVDEAFVFLIVTQSLLFLSSVWERLLRYPLTALVITAGGWILYDLVRHPATAALMAAEPMWRLVSFAGVLFLACWLAAPSLGGSGDRSAGGSPMWRLWSVLGLSATGLAIAVALLRLLYQSSGSRPYVHALGTPLISVWAFAVLLPLFLGAAAWVLSLAAAFWLSFFGVEFSPAAVLLLKVAVEPAPEGVWEVRQLAWAEDRQGLSHSLTWQHPDALQQLRQWLLAVKDRNTGVTPI